MMDLKEKKCRATIDVRFFFNVTLFSVKKVHIHYVKRGCYLVLEPPCGLVKSIVDFTTRFPLKKSPLFHFNKLYILHLHFFSSFMFTTHVVLNIKFGQDLLKK